MDPVHASCPIRLQAIPRPAEADIRDEELRDPLGEDSHNPAPSVIHKYPDRALFLVVDRCGIYCRHCNRRRLVGGDEPPTTADLEAGLDYLARTPRIRDVLLSGGDPLLLSTRRLGYLLGRLRAIRHIETLRIGTRLPVVCPMRIDGELTSALRAHHPLFVNTHFNHAKELTPEARAACERLVDAGIPVGNQTVLLRGVNSSVRSLRALMRGLVRSRVRPYYLFQGDTVLGTDHLRTPVDTAHGALPRPARLDQRHVRPRARARRARRRRQGADRAELPRAPRSRSRRGPDLPRRPHRLPPAARARLHGGLRRRSSSPGSPTTTTARARPRRAEAWARFGAPYGTASRR